MWKPGTRMRHRRPHTNTRLHPAAIIGIVLAVTVVLTVTVGNLLRLWLDDQTYRDLTDGVTTQPPIEGYEPSDVRAVNAYAHLLGSSVDEMIGQTSASVPINTPDGAMLYRGTVGTRYALPIQNDAPLLDSMNELRGFVPYVSGVFYPQAMNETDATLRYTRTCEEGALLSEFLSVGGSEILLCGLNVRADTLEEIEAYVTTLRALLGETPIGIAIPYVVATAPENWGLLARLSAVCDFCALDLSGESVSADDLDETGVSTSARALLDSCSYYTEQYKMRLLLRREQAALFDAAVSLMIPNFQILP